jgi:hypothetical protein
MNLHRDASSGKQNFPKNNISTCKNIFCQEKKFFSIGAKSLLKFQLKNLNRYRAALFYRTANELSYSKQGVNI